MKPFLSSLIANDINLLWCCQEETVSSQIIMVTFHWQGHLCALEHDVLINTHWCVSLSELFCWVNSCSLMRVLPYTCYCVMGLWKAAWFRVLFGDGKLFHFSLSELPFNLKSSLLVALGCVHITSYRNPPCTPMSHSAKLSVISMHCIPEVWTEDQVTNYVNRLEIHH